MCLKKNNLVSEVTLGFSFAILDLQLTNLAGFMLQQKFVFGGQKIFSFLSYDVRYFPKGFFPSANFQKVFSQMATTQICNFPSLS